MFNLIPINGARLKNIIYYDFEYTKDIDASDYTILGVVKEKNKPKKIAVFCKICRDSKNKGIESNGIFYLLKGNLNARQKTCFCSKNKPLTLQEKSQRLTKLNDGRYTFLSIKQGNRGGTVTYNCSVHGEKQCTYGNYLKGKRCPDCKNERTGDRCRLDAGIAISNLQNSLDEHITFKSFVGKYVGNTTNVLLNCSNHGDFERRLSLLNEGNLSCSSCKTKNRKSRNYSLYLLLVKGFGDIFLKIGITSTPINKRISKLVSNSIYDFETLMHIDIYDTFTARKIEKAIKDKYKKYQVDRLDMAEGFTETLSVINYYNIVKDVQQTLVGNSVDFNVVKNIDIGIFNIIPELGGWNDM